MGPFSNGEHEETFKNGMKPKFSNIHKILITFII